MTVRVTESEYDFEPLSELPRQSTFLFGSQFDNSLESRLKNGFTFVENEEELFYRYGGWDRVAGNLLRTAGDTVLSENKCDNLSLLAEIVKNNKSFHNDKHDKNFHSEIIISETSHICWNAYAAKLVARLAALFIFIQAMVFRLGYSDGHVKFQQELEFCLRLRQQAKLPLVDLDEIIENEEKKSKENNIFVQVSPEGKSSFFPDQNNEEEVETNGGLWDEEVEQFSASDSGFEKKKEEEEADTSSTPEVDPNLIFELLLLQAFLSRRDGVGDGNLLFILAKSKDRFFPDKFSSSRKIVLDFLKSKVIPNWEMTIGVVWDSLMNALHAGLSGQALRPFGVGYAMNWQESQVWGQFFDCLNLGDVYRAILRQGKRYFESAGISRSDLVEGLETKYIVGKYWNILVKGEHDDDSVDFLAKKGRSIINESDFLRHSHSSNKSQQQQSFVSIFHALFHNYFTSEADGEDHGGKKKKEIISKPIHAHINATKVNRIGLANHARAINEGGNKVWGLVSSALGREETACRVVPSNSKIRIFGSKNGFPYSNSISSSSFFSKAPPRIFNFPFHKTTELPEQGNTLYVNILGSRLVECVNEEESSLFPKDFSLLEDGYTTLISRREYTDSGFSENRVRMKSNASKLHLELVLFFDKDDLCCNTWTIEQNACNAQKHDSDSVLCNDQKDATFYHGAAHTAILSYLYEYECEFVKKVRQEDGGAKIDGNIAGLHFSKTAAFTVSDHGFNLIASCALPDNGSNIQDWFVRLKTRNYGDRKNIENDSLSMPEFISVVSLLAHEKTPRILNVNKWVAKKNGRESGSGPDTEEAELFFEADVQENQEQHSRGRGKEDANNDDATTMNYSYMTGGCLEITYEAGPIKTKLIHT